MVQVSIGRVADVGTLIKSTRTNAELTQADLAALIGTTQSAVSRWEHGRDEPRLSTLANIMRACGVVASIVVDDAIDRSQINAHLAMSPVDRLRSVANVSRLRTLAQPVAAGR